MWRWLVLASIGGVLIAILPPTFALAFLGVAVIGICVVLEPALALVVMLAVAPLKTLLTTETAYPLPIDIGQLAFAIAVGSWLVTKIARRQNLWRGLPPILYPILLFVGATLLTLPTAYSLGAALNEWVKWVEVAIIVYIVIDVGRLSWLAFGVVLAGLIQALIGLYEFQGGSGAAHLWILDYRYFRAFGTFGQPNPFGAFIGLTIPVALGLAWGNLSGAWHQRRQQWRHDVALALLYTGSGLVLILALFASWSRGAWLGFGAAGVALIWAIPTRLWHRLALIGGVAVIGLLLWANGSLPSQIIDRITDFGGSFTNFSDVRGVDINDDNYAVIERLAHWQSALEMAKAHPWLGVGFGNYEVAYPEFALLNWPMALGHAHNYYLNLLAETGIVGLLAYAIMWGSIVGLNWHIIQHTQLWQRGLAIGLLAAWVHLGMHSLVDKLYVNNSFLQIGVMLGLLGGLQLGKSTTTRTPYEHS